MISSVILFDLSKYIFRLFFPIALEHDTYGTTQV